LTILTNIRGFVNTKIKKFLLFFNLPHPPLGTIIKEKPYEGVCI